MTTIAPDAAKLREIENETRRAWNAYREGIRDLSGDIYEQAEHDSWTALQAELRRIERRRSQLTGAA